MEYNNEMHNARIIEVDEPLIFGALQPRLLLTQLETQAVIYSYLRKCTNRRTNILDVPAESKASGGIGEEKVRSKDGGS